MKTLVGLLALATLLLSTVVYGQDVYPALSQLSYDYYGAGARAFSMGNAFIGLSDDVSGGTWNPAGIWVIENPVVAATYLHYAPDGKFTDSQTPVATENKLNAKSLGSFSFVTPVRIKGHPWVFNFNYNRSNDYLMEANYFSGVESDPPMNPDLFLVDKGHLKSFRFGMTTRLYKQLSIGATANIYDARRYTDQALYLAWIDMRYEIPPIPDTIVLENRAVDSTTSNGLNFTIGLMYKLDKFSFGAVVHTPFTMKHSTDLTRSSTLTVNGLLEEYLSDAILADDVLTKQDMPLTIGIGFASLPAENLTFALDVNYQHYRSIFWYSLKSFAIDASGERTDTYDKYEIDWNNSLGVGLGGEYMLDTKLGRVPVRAGFRFDQLPQSEDIVLDYNLVINTEGDTLISAVYTASGRQNSYGFSLGTGIHWSQVELDFAWRYTTGAELNAVTRFWGEVLDEQRVERRAHEFRATFVGYF
jgi:hypothetical protein